MLLHLKTSNSTTFTIVCFLWLFNHYQPHNKCIKTKKLHSIRNCAIPPHHIFHPWTRLAQTVTSSATPEWAFCERNLGNYALAVRLPVIYARITTCMYDFMHGSSGMTTHIEEWGLLKISQESTNKGTQIFFQALPKIPCPPIRATWKKEIQSWTVAKNLQKGTEKRGSRRPSSLWEGLLY